MIDSATALTTAARSELGQRSRNEDRATVLRAGSRCLAIVADGAGGHRGGAEASRRAVEVVQTFLHDERVEFAPGVLAQAVLAAHERVQEDEPDAAGESRMHSTLVALWIDAGAEGRALWAHVGDSRLYRVRGGFVERLTVDDSIVQQMLTAGYLTPEQAAVHPQKNQLVAALGIEGDIDPHTPQTPHPAREGDAFLLCTDGWWDGLDGARIAATLEHSSSADEWLALMQQEVESRAAPKQDNFSAVAVWIGDPVAATMPMPL